MKKFQQLFAICLLSLSSFSFAQSKTQFEDCGISLEACQSREKQHLNKTIQHSKTSEIKDELNSPVIRVEFDGHTYTKTVNELRNSPLYIMNIQFVKVNEPIDMETYVHPVSILKLNSNHTNHEGKVLHESKLTLLDNLPVNSQTTEQISYLASISPVKKDPVLFGGEFQPNEDFKKILKLEHKTDSDWLKNNGEDVAIDLDPTGQYYLTTRKLQLGYKIAMVVHEFKNDNSEISNLVLLNAHLDWVNLNNIKQSCEKINKDNLCVELPYTDEKHSYQNIVIPLNQDALLTQWPIDKNSHIEIRVRIEKASY